jgi:Zn-dependent peptidase ImmA (M78 family)
MADNIIRQLRDLVPLRPLDHGEALRVAELQAARFLALAGVTAPPVASAVIEDLPRLRVEHTRPLPMSGAASWSRGSWLILLNADEAPVRRRFSLAHELKHVIDHPFVDFLYPARATSTSAERAEQICDYFAACLLMPKGWVKSAFYNEGIHNARELARRFNVSRPAMEVRLNQLGISEPVTRCDRYRREAPLVEAA